MQLLCAFVVVAVFSLIDAVPLETGKTPKFCNKLDCPRFVTKNKTADYEIRCYKGPYNWVSTNVEDSATSAAFMRLFRYIGGTNKKKVKIAMTVPVATQMKTTNNGLSFSETTMNFFVPFKYQRNTPAPSQPNVQIVKVKSFCAYVKVYGGRSRMWIVKAKFAALVKALKRDGLSDFSSDVLYTAGYDSPWKLWNRHNEIWLMKRQQFPEAELVGVRGDA